MKNGFTLIELLVVVAIIGVLVSVSIFAFNSYTSSTKETICKDNHKRIVVGVKLVYSQCKIGATVKLRRGYSNFQKGSEYDYTCPSGSSSLFGLVGTAIIHTANFLTNVYSPNNHWGYSFGGNTSTPNQEGQTYWYV